MSDKPSFLNINFTSFKQKQNYKPPTNLDTFVEKNNKQNKNKRIPGGEWANDDDNEVELQTEQKTKQFDPFNQKNTPVKKQEEKQNSKFNFIVRKQKDQNKTNTKDKKELLSLQEIRSEQQYFNKQFRKKICQ